MLKSLNDPDNVEYWMKLIRPLAKQRFTEWAESGEPVSLFRGMSNLVMTLLLYIFVGPDFAEKHAEELVPMIQAYEWSLQKPQTKVLPRSMSPEGRLLDTVEERLKTLIDEEVLRRLESPAKYEKNRDYLQMVLNAAGGKFMPSIPGKPRISKCSLSSSYSYAGEWRTYQSDFNIRLVPPTFNPDALTGNVEATKV